MPETAVTHSELSQNEKVQLIQNTLTVLASDDPKMVYAYKILDRLDSNYAVQTAQLTKQALADSPNLNAKQEMQLRVNILIKAFENLEVKIKEASNQVVQEQ